MLPYYMKNIILSTYKNNGITSEVSKQLTHKEHKFLNEIIASERPFKKQRLHRPWLNKSKPFVTQVYFKIKPSYLRR